MGIRIDRLAEGEPGQAWIEMLRSFDPSAARVLKIDDRTGVWRVSRGGRELVLKMWEYSGVGGRLKLLLRASRGWRHWRGARWLAEHGIGTARPLALMTEHGSGGPREWLVMEFLPGKTVLEHLHEGDLRPRQEHALAAAIAGQVSDMVARGRFNRDHKPSNLIVTGWDGDEPRIAIIDCVAIRRCGRFDFGAMRRMLASLYIEPLGVGCPPRRALCGRALAAISALRWWPMLGAQVLAHGDPRPRIDPVGR